MVMHGLDNTLGVTLDMMITHGKAVMRGSKHALVVVDMPFGSYEESPQVAFRNAARVIQETGATAVKMEGGARLSETIHYLTQRGIPVMGHIGLTPQAFNTMGGFKTQGRTQAEDGRTIEGRRQSGDRGRGLCGGALEAMAEPLAVKITREIAIPTIGIGASAECDGQILVMEDMLGLNPHPPKFVAAICAAWAGYRRSREELRGGCPPTAIPGRGKRLSDEEGKLTGRPAFAQLSCELAPAGLVNPRHQGLERGEYA